MIKSIEISIVATQRDYTYSVPVKVNVQKNLNRYVLRHKVGRDCQISYLGLPKIKSLDSISYDQDIHLIGRFKESSVPRLIESSVFRVKSLNFQLTNRALDAGGTKQPLFYGMALPSGASNVSVMPYSARGIEPYWEYVSASNTVYSSSPNYWDPELEDFRAITVSYMLDGEVKNVIFNSQNLYREMRIEDYDVDTLRIHPDLCVYSKRRLTNGEWEITLNGIGPWWLTSKISNASLIRFESLDTSQPWYPLVRSAGFTDGAKAYAVTEFDSQRFFPYKPYVSLNEKARVIDKRTLKLSRRGLVVKPDQRLNCDVILRDKDMNLKKAYTTNSRKLGKLYKSWDTTEHEWEPMSLSFDSFNSILVCYDSIPFLSSDNVTVYYVVESEEVPLRDLNLNPAFNMKAASSLYLFYWAPIGADAASIVWFEIPIDGTSSQVVSRTNSNISVEDLSAYVGLKDLHDYLDSLSYLYIGACSLKDTFDSTDLKLIDLRLKAGLDPKSLEQTISKYPDIFFDKAWSDHRVELPGKFTSKILIDERHVHADLDADGVSLIKGNMPIGSSFTYEAAGMPTRISDIFSVADDTLTAIHMNEKTGTWLNIYELRAGTEVPNPDEDTLIDAYLNTYTFGAELNPVERTIDVSALTGDVHRFYAIIQDGDYRSKPSLIYRVKIRNG